MLYIIVASVFVILFCALVFLCILIFFFFKQKTAYEMRISDWSSDVCSSDLVFHLPFPISHYGVTVADSLRALSLLFSADIEPSRVAAIIIEPVQGEEIGRASCRERVCQYV